MAGRNPQRPLLYKNKIKHKCTIRALGLITVAVLSSGFPGMSAALIRLEEVEPDRRTWQRRGQSRRALRAARASGQSGTGGGNMGALLLFAGLEHLLLQSDTLPSLILMSQRVSEGRAGQHTLCEFSQSGPSWLSQAVKAAVGASGLRQHPLHVNNDGWDVWICDSVEQDGQWMEVIQHTECKINTWENVNFKDKYLSLSE